MRTSLLSLFALAIGLQACAPVQGYQGPKLPDDQVSLIRRDFADDVELPRITADGMEFGHGGITLLPGKHGIDAAVVVKEPPEHCRPYTEFNTYGYESCLDDKYDKDGRNKYQTCDCYDYLEVHRHCEQEVHDGNCTSSFNTSAGRKYDIYFRKSGDRASMTVTEAGNPTPLDYGKCERTGSRMTDFEEYVGTGRSTANMNGIYHCD